MTTKFNQQRKFGIEIECLAPAIDYLSTDYCHKHSILKNGGNVARFNYPPEEENFIYENRHRDESPCFLLNGTRPWRDNADAQANRANCLLQKVHYGLVSSSMSRAQDLLTSWLQDLVLCSLMS